MASTDTKLTAAEALREMRGWLEEREEGADADCCRTGSHASGAEAHAYEAAVRHLDALVARDMAAEDAGKGRVLPAPPTCLDCPFFSSSDWGSWCGATDVGAWREILDSERPFGTPRPDWCPLLLGAVTVEAVKP